MRNPLWSPWVAPRVSGSSWPRERASWNRASYSMLMLKKYKCLLASFEMGIGLVAGLSHHLGVWSSRGPEGGSFKAHSMWVEPCIFPKLWGRKIWIMWTCSVSCWLRFSTVRRISPRVGPGFSGIAQFSVDEAKSQNLSEVPPKVSHPWECDGLNGNVPYRLRCFNTWSS